MIVKIYYTVTKVPHLALPTLLKCAQSHDPVFFFHNPDTQQVRLAYGALAECTFEKDQNLFLQLKEWYEQLAARLVCVPAGEKRQEIQPEIVGGLGFTNSKQSADQIWGKLRNGYYFLPQTLIVQGKAGAYVVACSFRPIELKPITTAVRKELQAAALSDCKLPSMGHLKVSATDVAVWKRNVAHVVAQIKQQHLSKVVLARYLIVEAQTQLDTYVTLQRLLKTQPETYHLLLKKSGTAFVSATPERFAKFKQHEFQTAALAGTTARGQDTLADQRLGQLLLNDHKNRQEHRFVVKRIAALLAQQRLKLTIPASPQLLKNKQVQHLYTPIKGTGPYQLFELLAQLHPTPALGGLPKQAALQQIEKVEQRSRGLFGAPLGYLDFNCRGELVVGIRAAVLKENQAYLFAGAGIVAESSPDKEVHETHLKFQPLLQALGGNDE